MPDLIHLLDQKVHLYQPDEGFRTSQDAVLLAAACPAKDRETVLEMGCGVGGALFCLLWRCPDLRATGLEIAREYLDLAAQNAGLNEQDVILLQGDVATYRVADMSQRFDHVLCNPPYYTAKSHLASPTPIKAAARGHLTEEKTLDVWIRCAFDNLKPKGSLTLIHQAEKTDYIIRALGRRFGAIEIFPLYSKAGAPAHRVIIRARKDRKTPCVLQAGIIFHQDDLSFSPAADRLLRRGESFETVVQGAGKS